MSAVDPGPRAPGRDLGPVVDVHAGFGAWLRGSEVTAEGLLAQMDQVGIATSVLVPLKPPGYAFGPANAAAASAVAAHPERLRRWARVDPWQGEGAVAELERNLDGGAVGLFLHPLEELFACSDPLVDPLLARCRTRGVPVMVAGGHVRYSTAWQLGELAGRHPEVTLIATSGGQINISGVALGDAETMLAEHDNVFMETSGIYREDFIEDMAERFGPERIVFGSGSPPYDRDLEMRRGQWAHLDETAREKILGANARRLGLG